MREPPAVRRDTILVSASFWVAAAAAWPVVAGSAAALVPAIALAFQAFDVGRDTPP